MDFLPDDVAGEVDAEDRYEVKFAPDADFGKEMGYVGFDSKNGFGLAPALLLRVWGWTRNIAGRCGRGAGQNSRPATAREDPFPSCGDVVTAFLRRQSSCE